MPTWRRTPIHCWESKRDLKVLVSAGHFFCLDLKSGFWQIKMDMLLKQYTAFTVSNLGFFKCDCMPFGLCSVPATFLRLMQNCLRELNLAYCIIYLDDIIVFLQMAEEHLHHLCVVFDQFREHNLKFKPSKCNFFQNKITYLAHWFLKDRACPSKSNLNQSQNGSHHRPTLRCMFFSVWWATTGGSSRDLHASHSPLVSISLERGPTRIPSRCCSPRMPWRPLRYSNRHVWQLPSWSSLNTPSCSCWRLLHPKMDWGQCCWRSRQTGSTTPLPMAAGP